MSISSAADSAMVVVALLYPIDARLIEAFQPLDDGLAKKLSPVSFTWRAGTGQRAGQADVGFIAPEVEEVLPGIVSTDAGGMKSVDYPKLVPVLVKAIQENQVSIDELKAAVAEHKKALEQNTP